jgi:UPF0755 protein
MKKKIIISVLAVILILAVFFGWKLFGPAVQIPDSDNNYLYIRTGSSKGQVKEDLNTNGFLNGSTWFNLASRFLKFENVKPGRYKMRKGMSVVDLVRMLRNGTQSPVNFVITKIRTKETLATRLGKSFEADSIQMINFLNNADSLKKFGLDTNTVMAAAMPFTYTIKWNSTPSSIFQHFITAYNTFWTDERKKKAEQMGLSPTSVATLASIIDEETNAITDKPNIASVYLNRISKGMPLQADPTIKFAMRNFDLRRILNAYLDTPSPYNTYINKGLPPGPICTPQIETLESVLNAPKTDYLYFVASPAFDGTHVFTTNYNDHMKHARIYQKELNKRNIK